MNYGNGLEFWTQEEIHVRDFIIDYVSSRVYRELIRVNPAWKMLRVETPILTPPILVSNEYDENNIYNTGDLTLRPETTAGSLTAASHILKSHNKSNRLPLCIWQVGKSFRREQDQPSKFCRYKEFHQMEFQCLHSKDTKNDYQESIQYCLEDICKKLLRTKTRLEESDRLPSYSEKTMDIEVQYKGRWMEICSISSRTDCFDGHKNLEIAFGLDRLVKVFNEE